MLPLDDPIAWLVFLLTVVAFWRLPAQYRYGTLASASVTGLIYCMTLAPNISLAWAAGHVGLMIAWVALFYWLGPKAAQSNQRAVVLGMILAATGYLVLFKAGPVLLDTLGMTGPARTLAAPLGISYLAFKLIHYSIEVARGNITDRSLQRFACYMFLLPIFTAGPIERFDHFLAGRTEQWTWGLMAPGINRIIIGLSKKFLLIPVVLYFAPFGLDVGQLATTAWALDPLSLWLFMIAWWLVGYMDFSAYSDLAIGGSRLFGIEIAENFNWPIFATNIREFWTRWHMTLIAWCQSYIYMPLLATTRKPAAAIFATFLTIGLWHAVSWHWVAWGLYHAAGLWIYHQWARSTKRYRTGSRPKLWTSLFCWSITILFVSAASVFTSMAEHGSLSTSLRTFARLFGISIA